MRLVVGLEAAIIDAPDFASDAMRLAAFVHQHWAACAGLEVLRANDHGESASSCGYIYELSVSRRLGHTEVPGDANGVRCSSIR